MKEFQQILEKYVGQYKDNRSKIKRRDTIRQFKEEALQIQEKAGVYAEAGKREQSQKNKIAHFITELNVLQNRTHKEIQELSGQIEGLHGAITHIEYEKLSYEIHNLKKEQENVFSNNKSSAIAEECTLAQFEFRGGTAIVGTGHIFYNMTGQAKSAKVLSSQSADGNLGNDGDFGYATLDEYNSFYLEHKTAYVWFDTKSNDANMPKLRSITLATEGVEIAGDRIYNFANGDWDNTITSGSSTITLNFEGGKQLQSANEGVMAAMVVLPAEVGGTKLTVTYTFEDESTFTEVKTPSKNFESGATQRISTTIALADLKS